MTLTVYLAGPYAARDKLALYADELQQVGYRIACRWLDETHEIHSGTAGAAADLADEQVNQHARHDLEDIDKADIVVAFTSDVLTIPLPFGGSGGRHVETGYALAKGKQVVLIGEPENVFHRMRQVERFKTWHHALVFLAARLVDWHDNAPREAAS